jgi:hypothetical protein
VRVAVDHEVGVDQPVHALAVVTRLGHPRVGDRLAAEKIEVSIER